MSAQIVVISCGSPKPLSRTLAPLAASARAMPRPIPLVDPVTMADLPTSILTGARFGIVLTAYIDMAHAPGWRKRGLKQIIASGGGRHRLQPRTRCDHREAMGKSLASVTGREMPGCYELD